MERYLAMHIFGQAVYTLSGYIEKYVNFNIYLHTPENHYHLSG